MVSSPTHKPHRGLELASLELRTFADAIRAGTVSISPKPECPWNEEIPALVRAMPLDRQAAARITGLGHLTAMTHLWSVTDHLYALSSCVSDRTLFSVASLARIILEAAASAAWLNNDGVDGETTLARHIKIHQKSIRSERDRIKKVKKHGIAAESPERLDQMLTGCKAQLDECATALNHLGNARNAVVPSKSQIVSEVLSLINLTDFPQLSYGLHSSFVHTEPYILINSLDFAGGQGPDMSLAMSMTVGAKLAPVVESLIASTSMIKTVSHWWDTTVDTRRIDAFANRIISIVEQYQDDPSEDFGAPNHN